MIFISSGIVVLFIQIQIAYLLAICDFVSSKANTHFEHAIEHEKFELEISNCSI